MSSPSTYYKGSLSRSDMENNDRQQQRPSIGILLRSLGTRLLNAKKYFLLPTFVLLGIWFVGRGLESTTHNTVFEPALVYWIMFCVFALLCLYGLFSLARYVYYFIIFKDRKYTLLTWFFFALIIAGVVFSLEGYQVSSKGFYAIAAGDTETAQQTLILLFKSNPANPLLPIQLLASEFFPRVVDVRFISQSVWDFPILFGFFVWSLLYGTFLLMFEDNRALKLVNLILSLLGVFSLMLLKSIFGFTKHYLIILHAGAVILLFIQVLLTYASLRYAAAKKIFESENQAEPADLLPPSALSVALVLIFLLPILTDIQNQVALTRSSENIHSEVTKNRGANVHTYITAAQISVRSGPALGDEVLGVLPKGTRISSIKEVHGWVCIGKNCWVSPKFLIPLKEKILPKDSPPIQ